LCPQTWHVQGRDVLLAEMELLMMLILYNGKTIKLWIFQRAMFEY
jgi:hypothetical protein